MSDMVSDRPIGLEAPETAAQIAGAMNRHECAHQQIEASSALDGWRRQLQHSSLEAPARENKESAAIIGTEHYQKAAAAYPTTESLSPEMSPESA